ncbi:MAG: hypothetical protein EOO20_27575 [Chryseobacterium sp.]|nr:MAG: hypothetical protein EOO20_27575 [Chryseobacterium sp.]
MMLQPFELFRYAYVHRLITLKKIYLVAQTYRRGESVLGEVKTAILLTDYDNRGLANIHLNALKEDKYASIINLSNENHKRKLAMMLAMDSEYRVYWSIVKSAKELQHTVNLNYKDKMKKFIDCHTNWRLNREITLQPALEVTFGELFISLKHAGQSIRVKFEEIEKV